MIKLFVLTVFTGVSMSLATLVSGAVALAMGGVAVCSVRTPEVNLLIPIPTHLVDAGLVVAHFAMPDDQRAEARRAIEPWAPMIDVAARELADVPDGTARVSVKTAEETVLVERRGGRFTVDVDTPDADVHVSFPARSFKRIANQVTTFL